MPTALVLEHDISFYHICHWGSWLSWGQRLVLILKGSSDTHVNCGWIAGAVPVALMSENPFEAIRKACNAFSHCFHTYISGICPAHLGENTQYSIGRSSSGSLFSFFDTSKPRTLDDATLLNPKENIFEGKITKPPPPLTKEELGRSTWTLLHTVAAQFPDHPTRQQKQDVKQLMAILSRLYPCKECANHFKEVLKANPVQAGSQSEFSKWLCHVHNIVNRSLGKGIFPCQRVNARWGKLDCPDHSCDLQGNTNLSFPNIN